MRPEELAAELGISAKTLRQWLRDNWPRSRAEYNKPWHLTTEQVRAARARWSAEASGAQERTYWWSGQPAEHSWVEIRKVPGLGTELRCDLFAADGRSMGSSQLVGHVRTGDVIYHWHATEHRFVGRSVAATDARIESHERVVDLKDFQLLNSEVDLERVRQLENRLQKEKSKLEARYPDQTLYLPFQYRSDGLRMVNYYFAKMPTSIIRVLFGRAAPPTTEGKTPSGQVTAKAPQRSYLRPFRPKADSEYEAFIKETRQVRSRSHETLVSRFAEWLENRGFVVAYNRAIDVGLEKPPVIFEAKEVKSWSKATREAIGQLYEYRYFEVGATKNPALVFVASKEVPGDWIEYLENDRGIGVIWPDANGFALSPLATRALTS